jgi:hypothetical protein
MVGDLRRRPKTASRLSMNTGGRFRRTLIATGGKFRQPPAVVENELRKSAYKKKKLKLRKWFMILKKKNHFT